MPAHPTPRSTPASAHENATAADATYMAAIRQADPRDQQDGGKRDEHAPSTVRERSTNPACSPGRRRRKPQPAPRRTRASLPPSGTQGAGSGKMPPHTEVAFTGEETGIAPTGRMADCAGTLARHSLDLPSSLGGPHGSIARYAPVRHMPALRHHPKTRDLGFCP